MTDGFTSTSAVPELRHPEHHYGVCCDAASHGASPRDPSSCSSLSHCITCAATVDVPPVVLPPPPLHPPYSAGGRPSDISKPSPYEGSIDYERKMDAEERDYRHWRGAQEQAREWRYQQWEQERARERDPRYEWMR